MADSNSWQPLKRWCPNAFIDECHDGRTFVRQAQNAKEHIAVLYGDGAILAAYVSSASACNSRKGGAHG